MWLVLNYKYNWMKESSQKGHKINNYLSWQPPSNISMHKLIMLTSWLWHVKQWMRHQIITVTVARSPSGTLATIMPIKKMTAVSQWYFRIKERTKKVTPRVTATPVMIWMKCSISTAIGVFPEPNPLAKLAIRPITVLSPTWTTIPVQVPSTAFVEKNAKFFVSKGFSWENSGVRAWGSDSPVREELSTWYIKDRNKTKVLLSWWVTIRIVSIYISINILRTVNSY